MQVIFFCREEGSHHCASTGPCRQSRLTCEEFHVCQHLSGVPGLSHDSPRVAGGGGAASWPVEVPTLGANPLGRKNVSSLPGSVAGLIIPLT